MAILAGICLLLSGCGDGRPATSPVRGKITFEGQAVTTGKIVFYPDDGRSAMSTIGPDGTYELRTMDPGDGAIPGKHVVTITATRTTGPAMPSSFEEELAGAGTQPPSDDTASVQWLVPEEYSQRTTTPLKAEVKAGENTIDFELPVAGS